jgi:hypothetical protein
MSRSWEVIVCYEDEYDPETGYYYYEARCGHKHKTKAAAQACKDKLMGYKPRCKTCTWSESGTRTLCNERCCLSVWLCGGVEIKPVNDPKPPRVPGFVPPAPKKRMTVAEFVQEILAPPPPKYD